MCSKSHVHYKISAMTLFYAFLTRCPAQAKSITVISNAACLASILIIFEDGTLATNAQKLQKLFFPILYMECNRWLSAQAALLCEAMLEHTYQVIILQYLLVPISLSYCHKQPHSFTCASAFDQLQ